MLHEDAPPQLAAILAAVESQDAGRLERAAHQLKGSLVPFEAPSAMKAVQALETMGHTQELSGTADGYRVLDAEMQRLLGAIKELTSPFNSHHAIPVLNDGTNHSEDSPCIV
jgi:HPt (histidine-containing phosphotransfer) domain-containing protein